MRMATYDMIRNIERDREQHRTEKAQQQARRRSVRAQEELDALTRLMWCDRCRTRQPGSELKRVTISGHLACRDKAACRERKITNR